jgi:aminoglycoside/choline kinase family phosphotransferase
VELFQIGDLEIWKNVARWLARMHRRFGCNTRLLERLAHVLRYDAHFYREWLQRARKFAPSRRMEWLASRYEGVIDRLMSMPRGLIHGEFYPSNLLVCQMPGPPRVCPVDWEMAAIGPPWIDLAALTLGKWSDEERGAIVLAYHESMDATETMEPYGETMTGFITAVDYCRLHLCVQWLGWAPNWSPPAEHTHDWLAEAMLLAMKLEL